MAAFTEDVDIMTRTIVGVQDTYSQLKRRTSEIGLKINMGKTNVLTQTRRVRPARIEQFAYFGVELCTGNTEDVEINNRITQTKIYFAYSHVFKSRNLNPQTKLRIYKTFIRPTATCASETWVQTKILSNELDIFRGLPKRVFKPRMKKRTCGQTAETLGGYRNGERTKSSGYSGLEERGRGEEKWKQKPRKAKFRIGI